MLIGAQFNQNLFARELVNLAGEVIPGTQVPETSFADLQHKLAELKPQFVRVFFSPHQDQALPSTHESFVKSVELAAVGSGRRSTSRSSQCPPTFTTPKRV